MGWSRKHQAHEAQMDAMTAVQFARTNGASKAEIHRLEAAQIETAKNYNKVTGENRR